MSFSHELKQSFVRLEGMNWVWSVPFSYRLLSKQVPLAGWDLKRKVWKAPATPLVSERLLKVIGNIPGVEAIDERLPLVAKLADPPPFRDDPPAEYRADTKPHWPDQLRAINQFFDRRALAPSAGIVLDMAMGSGKSRVVVDIIQNLGLAADQAGPVVLIVCPARVRAVWPLQIIEWAAADPLQWNVTVLGVRREKVPLERGKTRLAEVPATWAFEHRSSLKLRAEAVTRTMIRRGDLVSPTVIVVNYEAIFQEPLAKTLLETDIDLLVLDESHRAKAPTGRAAKYLAKLAGRVPARIAMTGTFMPHSPLDAFAQSRIIDPGAYGTSITSFKAQYMFRHPRIDNAVTKNPETGDWFAGELARTFFEDRLGRISYRVEMNKARLPELIEDYAYADLEPEAAKVYRELDKEMIAEVENAVRAYLAKHKQATKLELVGAVTRSKSAMNLVGKLQQVTCGFLKTDDGATHRVSTAKADLLADILSDLGPAEPVVIFARYHEDLDQIAELGAKLGRRCGEVSGRRADVEGKWIGAHNIDLLAVQGQSGAEGVDYTRSAYAFFWSLWGGGAFAQSRARIYRPGQLRTTRMFYLVTNSIFSSGKPMVDTKLVMGLFDNEALLAEIANSAIDRVRNGGEYAAS